jgi:hypothetical protein
MRKRKGCTAGVYVIFGTRGLRIGESRCLERRLPEVLREYGRCIGKVKEIRYVPEINRRRRRRIEKELIEELRPFCNPIRR